MAHMWVYSPRTPGHAYTNLCAYTEHSMVYKDLIMCHTQVYLVLSLLEEAVLVFGHLPDGHRLTSAGSVEAVCLCTTSLRHSVNFKPELLVFVSDIL